MSVSVEEGSSIRDHTGGTSSTLMLLGSISSVQCGAAVAQRLFDRVHPAGVVALRLGIAAVVLLPAYRPALRGRARRDWVVVSAFGVVLASMNLCFYEAVDRLPLGMAVTIELLGPLGLAVAMSRRWRELAWCGLAIVGVALLGEAGHDVDPAGVAFALAAAGCWAGYILLSRETGRRFRRFDGLALAMGVGVLVTGPIAVGVAGTALLSPTVLAAGAVVAVLSALIPFSLEIVALRRTSPRTFGVLMSLSPAAATLSGFVLLHQQLGVVQLTAIACVIIASAGTVMGTSGRTPRRLRHLSRSG